MRQKILQSLIKEVVPPASGNVITYDTEIPGFGMRITKAGTVSFVLNYHIHGRERRYTIGKVPTWTATAARVEAKRLRQDLDRGIDPLELKHAERTAPSVSDLYQDYCLYHLKNLAEKSQKDQQSMWQKYILPKLGEIKVKNIKSTHVDQLHREITLHAPIRANRVLEVFRKSLNLAIRWEWISSNPAATFQKNVEHQKERFLTEKELEKVTTSLSKMPNQQAADAIRLLVLTGARRGEVLNAEWAHFDLPKGLWVKPPSHTKARREHRTVLSVEACSLLAKMKKKNDGKYLFPSTKGKPIPDFKRSWEWLKKETGLNNVRIHDLRHTYASILISHGVSLPIIGKLLGHTQYQTTQRYAKLMDDPLFAATNLIGEIAK